MIEEALSLKSSIIMVTPIVARGLIGFLVTVPSAPSTIGTTVMSRLSLSLSQQL